MVKTKFNHASIPVRQLVYNNYPQPREFSPAAGGQMTVEASLIQPTRHDALRRRLSAGFVTALILAMARTAATAQAPWPTRPVHLVVPGGPGGVTDVRARWLADRLGPVLGQPVVVEDRAGAGGNIGMEHVARSAPDGYTLAIIHQGTMAMNPHLYARTGYDALADFVPITRLGMGPLMLAVPADSPAKSAADLIRIAKARPGQLSFGSPGNGTPPHLASELFKRLAGIDVMHIPYSGGGQETQALVAGQIDFTIEGLNVQLPQVKGGRLRALAVTSASRLLLLPDVPTLAEAGAPGYEFIGWVGVAAPAATPPAIIDRLYRAIAAVESTAEARDWFAAVGAEPGVIAPDAFAAVVRAEYAHWARVIRDAGIRLE
jgi:tripartite-type tricarboxylate transporter receptor subunit TctC